MASEALLPTAIGALVFSASFLLGGRFHPLQPLFGNRRNSVSFGAGMCAAYVFVRVMPEVHLARTAFAASDLPWLRYEGMAIYFVALVGFLLFYGLNHLRGRLRQSVAGEAVDLGRVDRGFRLHIGGFAAYVGLMAYLLVHQFEAGGESIALYTVAIACHFLALDHSLREEHGAAYQRVGRFVLAAMALAGWLAGLLVALPAHVLALVVAFISGAIIMNSLIMELPAEKDGRFAPFMAGGIIYGLILIPLG